MVQAADVNQISKAWDAAGQPCCTHERTDVEYYLGSQTGDVACLACGEAWPRSDPKPGPTGTKSDAQS